MLSALAVLAILRKVLRRLVKRSRGGGRTLMIAIVGACVCLASNRAAVAQDPPNTGIKLQVPSGLAIDPEKWTSPEGLSSTIQVMLLLTVLSLAPAVMLMTTCFVRIVVVLGILRQALGTQQLPPSQVITS